jgi:hypothetical protein
MDRDCLCVNKSQFVPVIFEPPCTISDPNNLKNYEDSNVYANVRRRGDTYVYANVRELVTLRLR